MRRMYLRQMTHDDLSKLIGERRPKRKKPLTDLQAFGVIMSVFVGLAVLGLASFVFVAWLAWDDHTFAPNDLRYWAFIRGTLTERVGAIDAEPGTLIYRGRGRDGTAPGFIAAQYKSPVDAGALLERFAQRCRAVGLHAKVNKTPSSDGSRKLSCGRTAGAEYALYVSVEGAAPAAVFMSEEIED